MRALLDVNVLIALLDAGHVHHLRAAQWLNDHLEAGWASCPLTSSGCIRIMSQPAYPGQVPAAEVAGRLRVAASQPWHAFWAADLDPLAESALNWAAIMGHRQVADAYLLALAVSKGGCFVTLDQRIALQSVPGARAEHLVSLV